MDVAQINGAAMAFGDTGGTGTPIVLVHAFPLHSGMWEPQLAALGDRFRMIAPDLRGFGRSPISTAYSMDNWADDLAALLDRLGIDRCVVGGCSMGGYVTMAFLRRHGDRVSGLVLADTKAGADTPEIIAKRNAQQAQIAAGGIEDLKQILLTGLVSDDTRHNKTDVVETVLALMDNPDESYIGALDAIKARPDSTDLLAGVTVPTLIVVGEHDALTPPSEARTMHEHISGSKLVVLSQAGHLSNLEAPQGFNGALAEFLGSL